MGMRCTACGEVNRDDARFCAACGVRIQARCTTCDRELAAGAKFCDGCGAPVAGAEHAGAGISADGGQQARKTVTIVFADLQGSTGLQERMDPESVRALMARYYAAMRETVDAHAGKVVKFVGDGVMAVFGVPDVAEDDAVRAVRAAAAMQAAFRPIADAVAADQGAALALRVGVNTGEVVVDADDADVVGDAVNVAARLESAAAGGDVLVGGETWRLARQAASFEPVPPLTLRGRAEPVIAHRLCELSGDADTTTAPFVGRAEELATLRSLFDTVSTSRTVRLATIIGSPGVGKSRLVGELRNALGDAAVTLVGQCYQAGGATFAPVADLLADLGDADALLADDAERDRLRASLEGFSGAGVAAGAQTTPEETFWGVRRLIEIAARTQPVVAVLDDVQWAEPLLLDLVEHLAEWISGPVLLIAVARPELRELRPSLTESHGRAGAVLALEGLDTEGTARLACELLGTDEVPTGLLERVAAGSDGNPLFVRELVRMLIDDGVVRRDGDTWTLAVEADQVDVPPTIQSLLAARLDRLRAAERTVLERAAVIGAEVYRGALVELVPPEVRADLDGVLESLRRKELLEPAGTYWIDERVLRFHHALIRDAAYRRLLKDSRAGLHERVAAWLVTKTGGGADHDETIGYHLEQAQATRRSLGPLDDDTRVVATDAAARLGRAARRALDRDDLLAAAGLAGRAIACLDSDDRARAELLLTSCEALLGAGDVAAAAPAVDELSRLSSGSTRLEAWSTCFDVQRTSLVDSRALAEAEARLTTAAFHLGQAGDSAGAAKAHRVHASVLARLGRVGDCEAALDRALGAAREAGDRRQTTSVLSAAPLAALWGPSPVPRAGGRCLDVIRLVRITTGAPAVEATSIRCQAVLEAFRGRLDAARSLIAAARAIAEELGLRHGLLEVELFAGIVELCGDDAAAAAEHLGRAQDGFTAMGVTTDAAQAAALRARAVFALGRADEALEHAATSEQLGGQDLKTVIAWRAVKAEVLAARGSVAEATGLAQAAVDVAARTDALIDHADALAALAAVQRAAGNSAAARRAADEAQALYEQKGATALAARVTSPTAGAPVVTPESRATPEPDAPVANTASRLVERHWRSVLEGDLDACADLIAEDFVHEDRRQTMQNRVTKANWLRQLNLVREMEIASIEAQAIAVRGDRLALTRTTYRDRAAFELVVVTVGRVNAEGRAELGRSYDPADLRAALQELDELYAAQLPAPERRSLEAGLAAMHAHNRRDWNALRALLTRDVRVVDHRPGGPVDVVGADAFVDYARAMVDVALDHHVVARRVLAISNRHILGDYVTVVTGSSESSYEEPRILLTSTDADGKVDDVEFFAPEQLDDAWARYRELSSESDQRLGRYRRTFDYAMAGRFDEIGDIASPDYLYIDRRTGFGAEARGLDELTAQLRAVVAVGTTAIDIEELATRGERLALLRRTLHAGHDFAVEMLWLFRVDGQGRNDLAIAYDPADLRAAFEELDALYIAGEGSAHAAGLQLVTDFLHSYNARDWDGVRAFYTDDVVTVDHRPTGFGVQRGVDDVITRHRSLAEVVPDATLVIPSYHAMGPRYWIVEMRTFAPRAGAEPYELESVTLAELQPAARTISRLEHFTTIDQAWARHRELTAEPTVAERGNDASRVSEIVLGAIVEGRIDELTSLISPAAVTEDRRVGMTSRVEGFEQFRALAGLGITSIDYELKATRGDRLALSESVWRGDFEVRVLALVQLDESGRMDFSLLYEPDDLLVAIDDLDELYIAGEGAPYAETLRTLGRATKAFDDHRWDDLRPLYAEDIVSVDHEPTGFGEMLGADALLARHRAAVELAPDYRLLWTRVLAVDAHGSLSESTAISTTTSGAAYTRPRLFITRVRAPGGPIVRFEHFGPDQLELAWERYRVLSRAATTTLADETVGNEAFVSIRAWFDALLRQDWDRVASLLSDDVLVEDRRDVLRTRVEGRAAVLEWFQTMSSMGLSDAVLRPVAFRGERLILVQVVLSAGAFELTRLVLADLDASGRAVMAIYFDPADIEGALIELDERYLMGEGAEHATWIRRGLETMCSSHNGRNWERMATGYAPDVVYVDHRPAGAGEIRGVDRLMAYHRAFVDVAPSHRLWARRLFVHPGRVVLNEFVSVSDESDGVGQSERVTYIVCVVSPTGVVERMEQFSEDDLAAAQLRTSALSAAADRDENAAMVPLRRWFDAMVRDETTAVADLMLHPDFVLEDRRPMFGTRLEGRPAALEWFAATRTLGLTGVTVEAIAMRGERLALVRRTWLARGYELTSVCLAEVDEDGLCLWSALYDPDQLDDALTELDERFLSGEGAPDASWLRASLVERPRAHADRDWDALRAIYSPDIVLVDRRPAGSGEYRGVDAVLDYHRAMVDVAPTHRQVVRRPLGIRNRVALAELVSGTEESEGDVGPYEVVSLLVTVHDPPGHLTRVERFGLDQLDAAWARFHELSSETAAHQEENTACAAMRRWLDAFREQDWNTVGGLLDPDFVFDDRRSLFLNRLEGRADTVEGFRAMIGIGMTGASLEPVAWRGEQVALVRLVLAFDAFEVVCYVVMDCDEHGTGRSCAVFDADDLEAALNELDERYLAGEGAAYASWLGVAVPHYRLAHNHRDWAALRALYAPDVAFVDHRPAGAGTIIGADAAVAYHRTMVDVAPSHRHYLRRFLALADGVTLLESVTGGGDAGAVGEHESVILVVVVQAPDGRLRRFEQFGAGALDAARARFHELAREA